MTDKGWPGARRSERRNDRTNITFAPSFFLYGLTRFDAPGSFNNLLCYCLKRAIERILLHVRSLILHAYICIHIDPPLPLISAGSSLLESIKERLTCQRMTQAPFRFSFLPRRIVSCWYPASRKHFSSTSPSLRAVLQESRNKKSVMATLNTKAGQAVDRAVLDSMLRRRLFYTPSFEIYGGVSGLYDYGPPGCAVLNNIIETWRKHFVLEEDMLEVDCTMLTPEEVLKTSGHVEKFADWMCKDPKTGEIFRADHLVEEVLEARLKGDKEARGQKVEVDTEKEAKKKKKAKSEAVKLDDAVVKDYEEVLAQIDNFDGPQLEQIIAKYDIRNPVTGGNVLPPVSFNLMFQTSIGPSSNMPGYLRPETAQGQFLNFQKLLEFNQQAMPFASASIGKSFRNEISPRAGLLRVREFLMAEIEHFVDPEGGKKHARFDEVKDIELTLLNRDVQLSGSTKTDTMTVGKAVEIGLVDNETLGYFLARIQLFLLKIGVDSTKLRFRQHMANEMAHYACDCWDAELLTSYGWIECVGCADRSAYDLNVHKNKTGAPLVVRETRAEPLKVEEWQIDLDKKKFGPRFKKDGKTVEAAIDALSQDLREKLALDLEKSGKVEVDVAGVASGKVELEKDIITIEKRTRVENVREYTPNVIEPSFGIGRILYSLMEHVYWYREGDEARGVSSRSPVQTKSFLSYFISSFYPFPRLLPLLKFSSCHYRAIPRSALWCNS